MDSVEPTQIKVKQLFYQMKEFFPDVPDTTVRLCLKQVLDSCFGKKNCYSKMVIVGWF